MRLIKSPIKRASSTSGLTGAALVVAAAAASAASVASAATASTGGGLSPGRRQRKKGAVQDADDEHDRLGDEHKKEKEAAQRSEQGAGRDAVLALLERQGAAEEEKEPKHAEYEEGGGETNKDGKEEVEEEEKVSPQNVLHGMERKQDIFAQLWQGIAQLQNESGESVNAWKAKNKELEAAKREIGRLSETVAEAKARDALRVEEAEALRQEVGKERRQSEQAGGDLSKHKQAAQKLITGLEESRRTVQLQFKDLKQREETVRLVAERRALELNDLRNRTETLEAELQAKVKEVERLDPTASEERDRLRERLALVEAQSSTEAKDNEEMNRHLGNLTQETWTLKQSLADATANNKLLEDEGAELRRQAATAAEEAAKLTSVHTELMERLKKTEGRMNESREAAQLHSQKLEEHVASLQQQLGDVSASLDTVKQEASAQQEGLAQNKSEAEAQVEKMRVAMRHVQDKHLQDVIRFEEQRTKLEARLSEEEASAEKAEQLAKTLKEQVATAHAASKSLEQGQEDLRANWTAQMELQYEAKLASMLETHHKDVSDVKTRLAEAKAAVRNEAREAQRYKNTLAKAAKEEHDKLTALLSQAQGDAKGTKAKLAEAEAARDELQATSDAASAEQTRSTAEHASREEELQRAVLAAQHNVTATESTHARECDRLRADVDKQKAHLETAEAEKRDLILELKKLNGEALGLQNRQSDAEAAAVQAKDTSDKLLAEVKRVKEELSFVEGEAEQRIDSLQREIDEHVASRRDALSNAEQLRQELRQSTKDAAAQAAAFSGEAESSEQKVLALEQAAKAMEAELEAARTEAETQEADAARLREELKELNEVHASEVADVLRQLEDNDAKLQDAATESERLQEACRVSETALQALKARDDGAAAELEQAKQALQSLEKSKQEAFGRLGEETESVRLLRLEIAQRKQDFADLNKELAGHRAQANDHERRWRSAEAALAADVEQGRKALLEAATERDAARKEVAALQASVAGLQATSERSRVAYMEEVKVQETKLGAACEQLRAELKQKDTELLDERSAAARLRKHAKLEAERRASEAERLQTGLRAAQEGSAGVLKELKDKSNAYDTLTADFEGLSTALQSLEKKLAAAERAKVAADADLEAEKLAAAELRAQLTAGESDVRARLRAEAEAHQQTKKELSAARQQSVWSVNETNVKVSALTRQAEAQQADLRRKEEDLRQADEKLALERQEHVQFKETANAALAALRQETAETKDDERRDLEEARATADQAAALCAGMEADRATLKKKLRDVAAELEAAVVEREEAREEHARATVANRELTASTRKLEVETKTLRLQMERGGATGGDQGPADEFNERLLLAEQEGYNNAKAEFNARVEKVEKEHADEVSRLKEQRERRDTLFAPTSVAVPVAGADLFPVAGDRARTAESTASTESEVEYFQSGPSLPPAAEFDAPDLVQGDTNEDTKEEEGAPVDAAIRDTSLFLEARRQTLSSAELRLPAAKGAMQVSDAVRSPVRRTLDSVASLEQATQRGDKPKKQQLTKTRSAKALKKPRALGDPLPRSKSKSKR